MNNEFKFKNFIKRLKEENLSEGEQSILRSKISEFISFSPIRGPLPKIGQVNYLSIFTVRHFIKATSLVLIISIVVGGSGVSYAASSALPGDVLYGIKVNVNEEIEDALATTPQAKLQVESKKVERRLEEAQVLVKEKKLTSANKKIVEEKLDEHLTNLSKQIEEVKKEGDVASVLETTGNLTPVLEAHKQILEDNAEKNPSDKDTDADTVTLIAKVDDSIAEVQDQEDSIIASLQDEEAPTAIMATMSVTAPEEDTTLLKTAVTPEETAEMKAQRAEEIALRKSEDAANERLERIHEDMLEVIEGRIKTAQGKIIQIKAEVAADEALEKSRAEEKAETLPSNEKSETPIESTKFSSDLSLPVVNQVTTEIATNTIVSTFDTQAKIKSAEALIREAKDLFSQNKFKEALQAAQEVNRIASEIETHRKLKALELAQSLEALKTSQKAEVSSVLKSQ